MTDYLTGSRPTNSFAYNVRGRGFGGGGTHRYIPTLGD